MMFGFGKKKRYDLRRINEERARRRLAALSEQQASSLSTTVTNDNMLFDFLVGYTTGMNLSGSSAGLLGAMAHETPDYQRRREEDAPAAPIYNYDPPPSSGREESSYGSESKSESSVSETSSSDTGSTDSGSSDSGGGGGGDGGGGGGGGD
jgi:uncharacterized membrane protein YgcG